VRHPRALVGAGSGRSVGRPPRDVPPTEGGLGPAPPAILCAELPVYGGLLHTERRTGETVPCSRGVAAAPAGPGVPGGARAHRLRQPERGPLRGRGRGPAVVDPLA